MNYVATHAARARANLILAACQPEIIPLMEEGSRTAYLAEGKLEDYSNVEIKYFPVNSYSANIQNLMVVENVGACILTGYATADTQSFGEISRIIGAIQISGTNNVSNLPFLITSADYCMIAEELYVASAYLSQDPTQLGSVAGQDTQKLLVIVLMVLGTIASTLGIEFAKYLGM
jgi:hypothetical protein